MRTRAAIRAAAVAAASMLALLLAPGGALARVYVVNTTQDVPVGTCDDGTCSLREAIQFAGVAPADTITLPAGEYVLSQGDLFLSGERIDGAGARATFIDANGATRVFTVVSAAPAPVTSTVTGVTIREGNGTSTSPNGASGSGGGVYVQSGTLILNNSHVVANTATSGGGGIGLAGGTNLSMAGTTVTGNTVAGRSVEGGGIGVSGTASSRLALVNSTVSGNAADANIGFSSGGGLYAGSAPRLVLTNVTIAGNRASVGGGIAYAASADAAQSGMGNTLLAGNTGGACVPGTGLPGVPTHHNLVDESTCALGGTGDIEGLDPQLLALGDNGGPTDTRALQAGSPAIDKGGSCEAADQRGVARPTTACDIGAFEYVPPPPQQSSQPPGLPPPVIRKSVNMIPARGTIRIKRPGQKRFRKLADEGAQLPVGTSVDARNGRVTIVVASDAQGGTDTAVFYGGIFKIAQTKGNKPTTVLRLTEKLSCPKAGSASIAATKKKKRRLWGDGSGKFRTKGKHSAATVVGTKWLVEDRCKSTLTRVVRGRVSVRDFVKEKTVIVRAGKRYIARAS